MLQEGIQETQFEHLTIQEIIYGTEENGEWTAFRPSLVMSKDEAYSQTIRKLEDMMNVYVTELTESKYE